MSDDTPTAPGRSPERPRSRRPRPRAATVVATVCVAAAIVTATAACATRPNRDAHRIATLETPSSSATATTPPLDASQSALFAKYGSPPRDRLDDTPAESEAHQKPYNDCIADNGGGPTVPKDASGPLAAGEETPQSVKAEAYCAPLQSLPPIEYDRQNPDALRFTQAVVDCLRSKGVKGASIAPDDGGGQWGVQFDDATAGLRWISDCQRIASAGNG